MVSNFHSSPSLNNWLGGMLESNVFTIWSLIILGVGLALLNFSPLLLLFWFSLPGFSFITIVCVLNFLIHSPHYCVKFFEEYSSTSVIKGQFSIRGDVDTCVKLRRIDTYFLRILMLRWKYIWTFSLIFFPFLCVSFFERVANTYFL